MAKIQRQWKTGTVYTVQGPAKRKPRKMTLIAKTKIDGREVLLLQVRRKADKHHR
jgi:hypothetical protein